MKKSDVLRIKTRKLLAKNLIILVALAVVAYVTVFSWFTQNTTAIADGIHASTEVNDKLEYYIMPPSDSDQYAAINTRLAENAAYNTAHPTETQLRTQWHQGAVIFDFSDQEFKFMSGLFLSEVTGDGTSFKIPKLFQSENIAYVDSSQDFEDAVANDNYMSFDLYFRSKSVYNILLKYDSMIEPVNKENIASQKVFDLSNADDEALAKPAAIGAVRLSILNCESNNARELLWIPGPNVWYDGVYDKLYSGLSPSGTDNYSFTNKGSVIWNGSALTSSKEGTTSHAYFDSSTKTRKVISSGVTASTNGDYSIGQNSSSDITVMTLPEANHDTTNGYYYGHVRVNLWLEGEDAEARLKLVNGKFNMNLHFDIQEVSSSGN